MTNDELRAAAERLLKYAQVAGKGEPWNITTAHKAVYKRSGFTRVEDEKAVCVAYLALTERTTADETPTDTTRDAT